VLRWFVGLSALVALITTSRHLRREARGWLAVNAVSLGVVLVGVAFDLPHAGYTAFAIWGLLVGIPSLATRRMQTAAARSDLRRAAKWAKLAALLHPWDGVRHLSLRLTYEYHLDAGTLSNARRILDELEAAPKWKEFATLERHRLAGDWQVIAEHELMRAPGSRDLNLSPLYLRANGELGRIDDLFRIYRALPPFMALQPAIQLRVAQASGLTSAVETLIARHFPQAPPHFTENWRAATLQARGEYEQAERLLQRILASNTGGRFAAEQRLAHPLPLVAPNELEPATRASIIAFDKRLAEQQHALLGPAARERPPLATLAIGAALIAYFVVSLPGGSMDAENLVALGALVLPIDLVPGELWWRVFAAGFLHFGLMHLAMNLLGLWFLGTAIERYGRFLPVVVFLFASMGAFLLAVGFAEASAAEPRILVGASAGIKAD
jgi:rhomboid protease GluP